MASDIFHFRSTWRVPAPLEVVWNTVGKVTEYPAWWEGIKRVELITGKELPIAVGTKAAYEVHSPLYTLHYQTEVTQFTQGVYILATSTGDLQGTGKWTFTHNHEQTQAVFDWDVALQPPLLRAVSGLPGAKSIMRYFHDRLMSDGEKGLQALIETKLKG